MRIEEYVEEYRQILGALQRAGIYDPDAAKVVLQERGRDRRTREVAEERAGRKGEPATERQKKFLEVRGVAYPRDITKSQASEVISRIKEPELRGDTKAQAQVVL
jgi:hypothetical protein